MVSFFIGQQYFLSDVTETNGFSCAIRARMYFNVIWRSRVKPEGNKDEESLVKPDKQVDLY